MHKYYKAALLIMLTFVLAPTEWGQVVASLLTAPWTTLGEIGKYRVSTTTRMVTNGPRPGQALRMIEGYPPTNLPTIIQLVSLCSACVACYVAGRWHTGVTAMMG